MAMVGTNLRPVLRLLIASAVALLGIALSVPVAAAEPCSVLDLSCVVDQTAGTVGDTVDETVGTVGDTVEQTGGTETVGGALEQVSETVGGVLSGVDPTGGTTTTDPGGQTGGTPGGGGGGTVPGGGGGGGVTPPDGGGTPPPAGGGSGVLPTADTVGPASIGSGNGSVSSSRGPTVRDPRTGPGSTLSLARTVAFPLALILVVLGFLSVQDRIDRKDPKLALAPVGSDYLTFS